MKQTVDARGLACPEPVMLTTKAMASHSEVTTIVDSRAAVENVSRLARSKGCRLEVIERDDGIHVIIKREGVPAQPPVGEDEAVASTVGTVEGPLVLFVPSDCFGRGPAELGERLMGTFFHSLSEVTPRPDTAIFMNTGVKLVTEGSPALDDVRALEARGIDILACGACLGYFELTDKLAVGQISNMYDIAARLLGAGKIVEL